MITMYVIVAAVGTTAGSVEANNPAAVKAMLAFICATVAVYATTWGPVAWVVTGEAFPLTIRSRGVGISTASCWCWNCILAVISPYMTGEEEGAADLGPKVFFVWAGFTLVGTTLSYYFVPETKGLSLEQIDRMLEEVPVRKSSGWKPEFPIEVDLGSIAKGNHEYIEAV